MMIVTQQDRIQLANLGYRDARPISFDVPYRAVRALILARGIEGGISEQAIAAVLDEHGWATYQGEGDRTGHSVFFVVDARS